MKLVDPSITFLWSTPSPLLAIELAGRTCYKSEDKITDNSCVEFVHRMIKNGHEAMLEHASMSYRVVCDRGVTHEIVRHRLFSYAQESTRYCNYKGGVSFIIPRWVTDCQVGKYDILWKNKLGQVVGGPKEPQGLGLFNRWFWSMALAERDYQRLLDEGCTPQQARCVLPNSLKTEIVITGNMREWRYFFKLRTDKTAHPDMRYVANLILNDAQKRIPVIFEDVESSIKERNVNNGNSKR